MSHPFVVDRAPSATPPTIPFSEDDACLATALRAACWATRTLPYEASVITLTEPEPLWELAAALVGVTLLGPDTPPRTGRVVAVLADAAGWPGHGHVDEARRAARRLAVPLVLDAPAALVRPETLAELAQFTNALVAVTAGDSRVTRWPTLLTGTARLLRHTRRGDPRAARQGLAELTTAVPA